TIGPRSREPLFRVPWLLARRPRIQRIPREANRAGAQPPPFARALPQFAPRVSECGQRLLPPPVPTHPVRPSHLPLARESRQPRARFVRARPSGFPQLARNFGARARLPAGVRSFR